jgi:phosphoribosylanthranilate isomerase
MKLKVCGLKYTDNIRQIAELNPDFMGFIFFEDSKRFVGNDFVMPEISSKIKKIGVFANAEKEYILTSVKKHNLDFVQLHGNESPEFCEQLSQYINIIKAFGLDDEFDFKNLDRYKKHCSFFLFDYKTESYGGKAKPFNLELLKKYDNSIPYFIAGGMDLEKFRNVELLNIDPYGIDVSNRMEIKPGYKDIIKIIQIKNNIR